MESLTKIRMIFLYLFESSKPCRLHSYTHSGIEVQMYFEQKKKSTYAEYTENKHIS